MCYARLGIKDSVYYAINKVEGFEPRSPARISAAREYQSQGSDAFNSGDWQSALKLYNIALEIYPNDADAFYYLGGVYLSRQDVSKAREYWRKAISINPQHAKANEWLGKIGS
jgi:tetratricopeptide (TPR) repeat protein